MGKLASTEIRHILEENLARATVFEFFSIDYLLFLDSSLQETAQAVGMRLDVLEEALEQVQQRLPEFDYDFLELPVLVAYLKHTHHEYARTKIPHIRKNLKRLNETELLVRFDRFSKDIHKHMMLEEKLIFPFILSLVELNESFDKDAAGALLDEYSTEVLCASHTQDDDDMRELRETTAGYRFSEYDPLLRKVVMTDLARLEEDLFRHARIEDNILFRKARMEEKMLAEKVQMDRNKN